MDFTSSFERKVKYGVFETGTCAHFYSNTTLLGLLRYSHELRYRETIRFSDPRNLHRFRVALR